MLKKCIVGVFISEVSWGLTPCLCSQRCAFSPRSQQQEGIPPLPGVPDGAHMITNYRRTFSGARRARQVLHALSESGGDTPARRPQTDKLLRRGENESVKVTNCRVGTTTSSEKKTRESYFTYFHTKPHVFAPERVSLRRPLDFFCPFSLFRTFETFELDLKRLLLFGSQRELVKPDWLRGFLLPTRVELT